MKYYLDEDLSPKISALVIQQGIDCISTHDIGMIQATDLEQLIFAGKKKRCMVTRNRNDFIRLTIQFFNDQLAHHGVLIIPHTFPGDKFTQIARALVQYAKRHPDGMQPYTIDFLSEK